MNSARRTIASVVCAAMLSVSAAACGEDIPFVDGACEDAINLSRAASRAATAAATDDDVAMRAALDDMVRFGEDLATATGGQAVDLGTEAVEIGRTSFENGEFTRDDLIEALSTLLSNAADLCRNREGEVPDELVEPSELTTEVG